MVNDTDVDDSSDFSPEELEFLNLLMEIIINISIREAKASSNTKTDE